MKNKILLEKINLILELLHNLSKEEWLIVKKYIDDNLEKINEMNVSQEKVNNILTQMKKELCNLEYGDKNENITFNSVNEMVECVQKRLLQSVIDERSINREQLSLLQELNKIKD